MSKERNARSATQGAQPHRVRACVRCVSARNSQVRWFLQRFLVREVVLLVEFSVPLLRSLKQLQLLLLLLQQPLLPQQQLLLSLQLLLHSNDIEGSGLHRGGPLSGRAALCDERLAGTSTHTSTDSPSFARSKLKPKLEV